MSEQDPGWILPLVWLSGGVKRCLLGLIGVYRRRISPALPPRCRFIPSCSEYAQGCLEKYGLFRAMAKIGYRLLRCQPFCSGGYDPP